MEPKKQKRSCLKQIVMWVGFMTLAWLIWQMVVVLALMGPAVGNVYPAIQTGMVHGSATAAPEVEPSNTATVRITATWEPVIIVPFGVHTGTVVPEDWRTQLTNSRATYGP